MHNVQPAPLAETSNKLYAGQLNLFEAFKRVSHRYGGISISCNHLRTLFGGQELQTQPNHD
jgi:hypothetical protein